MLVGVFDFCAIVCFLSILTANWDTFECQRNVSFPTQGQCTLTHYNLLCQQQHSWNLEQIKSVDLVPEGFQKNGSPIYRVDLHTTEGIVILPIVDRVYPEFASNTAEEIRQFLEQSQLSNLKKQRDDRPYLFFGLKLCLALAVLFAFLGEIVTLEISRDTQRLTIRRRNLLVIRTVEYPLDQIEDVIVQKQRGGKFGSMGRIAIVLKNGKPLVVHAYDRFDQEGNAHISALHICHFLGL
ncbi:MAG TPA: hypothetical protein V6C78_07610 [Crinalium sp.]|jgi:hypothetical protein